MNGLSTDDDAAVSGRPRVILLTDNWPLGGPAWDLLDEAPAVSRAVAGVLALTADVDVICTGGDRPSKAPDGVFEVFTLATARDLDARARIDCAIDALASGGFPSPSDSKDGAVLLARQWIRSIEGAKWEGAEKIIIEGPAPVLVVSVGTQHVGLTELLNTIDAPILNLPVCTDPFASGLPIFDDPHPGLISRLVTSSAEADDVSSAFGTTPSITDIGMIVPVNPSVTGEPTTEMADQDYITVLCPMGMGKPSYESDLVQILAYMFPDNPLAVVHPDSLFVWRKHQFKVLPPVNRQMDLSRLMAWAKCTVDLRPGKLLAIRAIESLRLGTPVLVPSGTRAARLARDSNGGLWFDDPTELVQCVSALLSGSRSADFGELGRAYTDKIYGSSEGFVDRISAISGLHPPRSTFQKLSAV